MPFFLNRPLSSATLSSLVLLTLLCVGACDGSGKPDTTKAPKANGAKAIPPSETRSSKKPPPSSGAKPPASKETAASEKPTSGKPSSSGQSLTAKYSRDIHFERYWGKRPDNPNKAGAESREAVARGRRAALKKDWSGAAQEFLRAVTIDPMNGEALGELGYARQQLGGVSPALFRTAQRLVASAGFLGGDLKTRGAIVHNLAKEYDKEGKSELAIHARRRSRLLKKLSSDELLDQPNAEKGGACPVVVRTAEKKIQFRKWGDIYKEVSDASLLPEEAYEDPSRLPDPNNEQAVRSFLCKSIADGGACETGRSYDLTYPKPNSWLNMYHLVIWPLGDGRAATTEAPTPLHSCEERGATGGRQKNFLTFLEYFHFPLGSQQELEQTSADPSCTTGGVEQRLTVHDLELQRTFHLDGGQSDTYVRLEPEKHALIVYGEFCGHRYFLKKCKNGICQPEPERMPPN